MELRVYTMDEAVKTLKLTRQTLTYYIKTGKLKGSKIGKGWRFTEEQLKDFLNSTISSVTSEDSSGELPGEQNVCDK